ncbi:MAG: AmmeMemoRadiSam system protein A [Planctomycetales bacterium]
MSSSETSLSLSLAQRDLLLDVADASIEHGLTAGRPLPVVSGAHPPPLRVLLATFVTLRIDGELRGCMGSLEATEPLVENVARNAFAAAFRDPRFPPLAAAEFARLDAHLSILSPPQPLGFASQAELLALVRPGLDGLILIEGPRRGTLLPAVWEHLPDPHEFLAHLKRKAGLPPTYWSDTLRVMRYTAESVARYD